MEEEKKLTEPTTPSPAGHKRRRGTRKHKGRGNRGKASAALHTPDGSPAAEPAPEAPQVPEEPKTTPPQTDAPPQDQETSAPAETPAADKASDPAGTPAPPAEMPESPAPDPTQETSDPAGTPAPAPSETGESAPPAPRRGLARLPLPLRILLGVFCVVAVLVGLAVAYVNGKLDLIRYNDGTVDSIGTIGAEEDQDLDGTGLEHSDGEMVMPEGSPFADDSVLNVLLISTDERTEAVNDADAFTHLDQLDGTADTTEFSEDARADSLILASLNIEKDTIKLVSIERATGVPILLDEYEGEYDWITHTFRYGGARLTMDTVETCFNVQVDHYVRFNFNSFVQIVDAVGGIDVELTETEAAALNWEVPSNSMLIVNKVHAGLNHFDGYTALQYARLRSIDSDWKRIERQRTVIQAVLDQIRNASVTELDNLLNTALPLVQTNFTKSEIAALLVQLPGFLGVQTEQMSMPVEGTYGVRTGMDDRTMYDPDWQVESEILQDFLYNGLSAEQAIAAHVATPESAEPAATAAPEQAGGYLAAYTQPLTEGQTLSADGFGETAYRAFLAGGLTDQAETWQAAAALLQSLHEQQGVNGLLYDCGPASALALNEQLADGETPAAASEEEAAFWDWLVEYNATQTQDDVIRLVGIGEEDPQLALAGLRTLLADTLPAIDPDTLTCTQARTVWRRLQDEQTYRSPALCQTTLTMLQNLAGTEGADSDLYQFFSGNVSRATALIETLSIQGSGTDAQLARLNALWQYYSGQNFFALRTQQEVLLTGDTFTAALNGADSPLAGRVCSVLLCYLDPAGSADQPDVLDAAALYEQAETALAEAAETPAEQDETAPTPAPTVTPDPDTPAPVLFLALDGTDSPYADLPVQKAVLIPESSAVTDITPEEEAADSAAQTYDGAA